MKIALGLLLLHAANDPFYSFMQARRPSSSVAVSRHDEESAAGGAQTTPACWHNREAIFESSGEKRGCETKGGGALAR